MSFVSGFASLLSRPSFGNRVSTVCGGRLLSSPRFFPAKPAPLDARLFSRPFCPSSFLPPFLFIYKSERKKELCGAGTNAILCSLVPIRSPVVLTGLDYGTWTCFPTSQSPEGLCFRRVCCRGNQGPRDRLVGSASITLAQATREDTAGVLMASSRLRVTRMVRFWRKRTHILEQTVQQWDATVFFFSMHVRRGKRQCKCQR